MKRNGFRAAVPLILCAFLLLSACGSGNGAASSDSLSAVPDSASAASESVDSVSSAQAEQILDTDALFSDRDLSQSYDEAAAVTVQLLGDTAACASDAVRIEGGTVTLTEEGVYLFTAPLPTGRSGWTRAARIRCRSCWRVPASPALLPPPFTAGRPTRCS